VVPPTVAVTPKTATLSTGGTQAFAASVSFLGDACDTTVAWSATGGSITQGGIYTAPWAPGSYTITATSAADGTTGDTATVTVYAPIAVSVSPRAATLTTGAAQAFVATVTGGMGNTAVTWAASGGSITQGGLYTAPATPGAYTITATSQEDPSKRDAATVTVASLTIAAPVRGLFVGGTTQFDASVECLADGAVVWSATGGEITPGGAYTAPAAPGTYTITATSVQEPSIAASVQVRVSTAAFDGNAKANPQLLEFAGVFGSTAAADLEKYDFDNSGRIDDGDLTMLFAEMGW
jgi:hypothetical protein